MAYKKCVHRMNLDKHVLAKALRELNKLQNPNENEDIDTSKQLYKKLKEILDRLIETPIVSTFKEFTRKEEDINQSNEETMHDVFIRHYKIPDIILSQKHESVMALIKQKIEKDAKKKMNEFRPALYSESEEEHEDY